MFRRCVNITGHGRQCPGRPWILWRKEGTSWTCPCGQEWVLYVRYFSCPNILSPMKMWAMRQHYDILTTAKRRRRIG